MKLSLSPKTWRFLIIGVLAVALAVLAMVKPWDSPLSPQKVLADAHTATASVSSYKFAASISYAQDGNVTGTGTFKAQYQAPDRYHAMMTETGSDGSQEVMAIGDRYYVKNFNASSAAVQAMVMGLARLLDTETSLGYLDMLTDVQTLPDETMDGVTTRHYLGKVDAEKQVAQMIAAMQKSREQTGFGLSDEQIEQQAREIGAKIDMSIELWVGADDSLIRQMVMEAPNESSVSTISFYDFNVPNAIEVPVDTAGQPQEGWAVVEAPPSGT